MYMFTVLENTYTCTCTCTCRREEGWEESEWKLGVRRDEQMGGIGKMRKEGESKERRREESLHLASSYAHIQYMYFQILIHPYTHAQVIPTTSP